MPIIEHPRLHVEGCDDSRAALAFVDRYRRLFP